MKLKKNPILFLFDLMKKDQKTQLNKCRLFEKDEIGHTKNRINAQPITAPHSTYGRVRGIKTNDK